MQGGTGEFPTVSLAERDAVDPLAVLSISKKKATKQLLYRWLGGGGGVGFWCGGKRTEEVEGRGEEKERFFFFLIE